MNIDPARYVYVPGASEVLDIDDIATLGLHDLNGDLITEESLAREADEAERQQMPGIVFRDGPAGRRAGVAGSLDVWEVVQSARQAGFGDPASLAVALGLPVRVVAIALDYYARFPDEIDEWIVDSEQAAEEAHTAWQQS